MKRSSDHYCDVLQAIYRIGEDEGDWSMGIVDAIAPLIDSGLGVLSFVADFGGSGETMRAIRTSGMSDVYLDEWASTIGGRREGDIAITPRPLQDPDWKALFVPRPRAITLSRVARHSSAAGYTTAQLGVMTDGLGIRGTTTDGQSGIMVSAPSRRALRLTGRRQALLNQLGSHLATAHRLRTALLGRDPIAAAVAVMSSGGEIVHMADDTTCQGGEPSPGRRRAAFSRGAHRLEIARTLAKTGDQEGALETWRALLSGRWSVIDHRDSDGKRFLLAIENPSDERGALSLSDTETQVIARLAIDHSLKLVAYELGLSRPAVSEHIRSALRKLRVSSIAEAIRLFVRQKGSPTPRRPS